LHRAAGAAGTPVSSRDLIHGNPAENAIKGDASRGSTGVTGFALTAMCVGAERGWIARQHAKDRVRRALRSYTNGKVTAEHGWFYHFIDVHTGKRWKDVEVSTSDSIWLLAGALTCRQCFHEDREIGDLATLLYSRYGIASPTHPLPPEAWYAWRRDPNSYGGYHYIGRSLLWTYQYPFAWFDFRGKREAKAGKVDWFENSRVAFIRGEPANRKSLALVHGESGGAPCHGIGGHRMSALRGDSDGLRLLPHL
jgi:hypothetical protein